MKELDRIVKGITALIGIAMVLSIGWLGLAIVAQLWWMVVKAFIALFVVCILSWIWIGLVGNDDLLLDDDEIERDEIEELLDKE